MTSKTKSKGNRPWASPMVGSILAGLATLLVGVLLCVGYRRVEAYAHNVVLKNQVASLEVRVALNEPALWLAPELLNQIAQETVDFAKADPSRYRRLQDPLDGEILTLIAQNYVQRQALNSNAWIKQIKSVQRVRFPREQRICITAEYRKPVAMIALGDSFYLLDKDGTRLPGEYREEDGRSMPGLMVIRGVDVPAAPEPGDVFRGADAQAGLRLVEVLRGQPYIRQIAAINVSNFAGRMDSHMAQISLDTVFASNVYWGRPVNEESFYEVSLAAKLKVLSDIFMRFNRIDAGRSYVDIRLEQVRVPKPHTDESSDSSGLSMNRVS